MSEERIIKFTARQKQLETMSDDELKQRFWDLCNKVVEPMVDYGRRYTSPSVERSVLLRMGISSQTALAVVSLMQEAGLLGKGSGNVVLKVSKKLNIDIREAAEKIAQDKTVLENLA